MLKCKTIPVLKLFRELTESLGVPSPPRRPVLTAVPLPETLGVSKVLPGAGERPVALGLFPGAGGVSTRVLLFA